MANSLSSPTQRRPPPFLLHGTSQAVELLLRRNRDIGAGLVGLGLALAAATRLGPPSTPSELTQSVIEVMAGGAYTPAIAMNNCLGAPSSAMAVAMAAAMKYLDAVRSPAHTLCP